MALRPLSPAGRRGILRRVQSSVARVVHRTAVMIMGREPDGNVDAPDVWPLLWQDPGHLVAQSSRPSSPLPAGPSQASPRSPRALNCVVFRDDFERDAPTGWDFTDPRRLADRPARTGQEPGARAVPGQQVRAAGPLPFNIALAQELDVADCRAGREGPLDDARLRPSRPLLRSSDIRIPATSITFTWRSRPTSMPTASSW